MARAERAGRGAAPDSHVGAVRGLRDRPGYGGGRREARSRLPAACAGASRPEDRRYGARRERHDVHADRLLRLQCPDLGPRVARPGGVRRIGQAGLGAYGSVRQRVRPVRLCLSGRFGGARADDLPLRSPCRRSGVRDSRRRVLRADPSGSGSVLLLCRVSRQGRRGYVSRAAQPPLYARRTREGTRCGVGGGCVEGNARGGRRAFGRSLDRRLHR